MKKIVSLLILSSINLVSFAQKKDGKVENTSFSKNNNVLIISYDLVKTGMGELFEINVILIDSGFKKWKLDESNSTGDLGIGISAGVNKNIRVELNQFAAIKGIRSIEIVSYSYLKLGGPSNALKSMLIPGLGNVYVYDKHIGLPKAVITLGLVGTSALVALSSKLAYDDQILMSEIQIFSKQPYLDKAVEHKKNMNTAIYVGCAIWATDVIWVAIKGYKNERNDKKKTKLEKNKGVSWIIQPEFYQQNTGVSFALNYKF